MPFSTMVLIALCLALGPGLFSCSRTTFLKGDGSETSEDPVHDLDLDDLDLDDQDLVHDLELEPEPGEPDLNDPDINDPELPAEIHEPDLDVPAESLDLTIPDEEEFEIPIVPETAWIRMYHAEAMSTPSQIRPTLDGGYVFAASGYSTESRISTIVKLDIQGYVAWARRLDLEGPNVWGIVQTADRGFVLLLGDLDFEDNIGSGLVKLDENGDFVWARAVVNSNSDQLTTFFKTRAGEFLLGGSFSQDLRTNFWLVLLDSHGLMRWQRALIGPGGNFLLMAVTQAEDGGFAAAGFASPTTTPVYPYCRMWLAKLDYFGNIQWQERVTGSEPKDAYAIIPAPGNGFWVTGTCGGGFFSRLFVMRLDEDGGILMQKTIGDISLTTIHGLCPAQDEGAMLVGTSSEGILGDNGALSKILEDGSVAWLRGYSESDSENLLHVQQTYDGGYVAVGSTHREIPFEDSPWVVKTDDAGVGWTDCPDILGYEMTLVTEISDFSMTPAMAVAQDTLAEVVDFELSTYEVEVEVETICEGE